MTQVDVSLGMDFTRLAGCELTRLMKLPDSARALVSLKTTLPSGLGPKLGRLFDAFEISVADLPRMHSRVFPSDSGPPQPSCFERLYQFEKGSLEDPALMLTGRDSAGLCDEPVHDWIFRPSIGVVIYRGSACRLSKDGNAFGIT